MRLMQKEQDAFNEEERLRQLVLNSGDENI